jgi:hypothetical protein
MAVAFIYRCPNTGLKVQAGSQKIQLNDLLEIMNL